MILEFTSRVDACFAVLVFFFFFNDTATTEIYTLSLHDALPISRADIEKMDYVQRLRVKDESSRVFRGRHTQLCRARKTRDRKSTRLNSSHGYISYAVFCLKKKNNDQQRRGP